MKLLSKERVGSKTLKRHDPPKTPYQRIMESPHIPPNIKHDLSKQLEKLNPFVLREGEMVIMPANQPHASKAVKRFKMLLAAYSSDSGQSFLLIPDVCSGRIRTL